MNPRLHAPAAGIAAICAALFLVGAGEPPGAGWIAIKVVPALCMAAIASSNPRPLGRAIMVGLVFSAAGDAILELPDAFVPGLVAFLVAHLCYLAAWTSDERRPAVLLAVPFTAYGLGMLLFLRDGIGPLLVPVAVYVLAICAMMWRAWARVRRDARWTVWAGALGVLVFCVSDSAIAVDRFYADVPYGKLVIMVTYWLGQAGITAATLRDR